MQRDRRSSGEGYFWPVLCALALHAVIFGLLLVSFSSMPELPPSQPLIQASLYQAKSQSQATHRTKHKIAGQDKKTAAPQYQPEELEKRKTEQEQLAKAQAAQHQADEQKSAQEKAEAVERAQQAKAAKELKEKMAAALKEQAKEEAEATQRKAKADAEAERQAKEKVAAEKARKIDEAKKAAQAKKEAAQRKAAAEKAKQAAEAERKKAAAQEAKQKEAAKAAAEAAKKKAAAEERKQAAAEAKKKKAAAQAAAARKAYEDKKAAAQADLLSDRVEREQTLADSQGDQTSGNIDDALRERAAQAWMRPPSARNGMEVRLSITMLPDGTITSVSVSRSSGDRAYDNSAVSAVRNIGRVLEAKSLSPAQFAPYRSFTMTFRPEDLEL